ncbi:HEXXH motif-containing putative peptide modification protein [Burkholderia sp. BCC0044]|uniref:aKG-HExxH-type peptide beta-hydroxylase n=1 Tax=Burkholderia sp. BCC0044 TaxID=2676295 RepID=UPI00158DDAF0|nr:HEXXH motif-containing putative peptide modification protein [Burkholderia sp. BCC0044]
MIFEKIECSIRNHRSRRIDQLTQIFDGLDIPVCTNVSDGARFPVRYASMHHIAFRARRGALTHSSELIAGARSHALALERSNSDLPLFADATSCWEPPGGDFSSAVYVLGADSRCCDDSYRGRIARIVCEPELFMPAGADFPVGIVVSFGDASGRNTHRSYTVAQLPGTVFIEKTASDFQMKEALVHEGAHCWLNDALVACEEVIVRSETRFHSPWKGEWRPAFNFLHAVVAFSTVTRFLASELAKGNFVDQSYEVLNFRLREHLLKLSQANQSFYEVLREISDIRLRGALENHYRGIENLT